MAKLRDIVLAGVAALAIGVAVPKVAQAQYMDQTREYSAVEDSVWAQERPILDQYSTILNSGTFPGIDRKLIIYADKNHEAIEPLRNVLRSAGQLYDAGLLQFMGCEGAGPKRNFDFPDNATRDFPNIANRLWEGVPDRMLYDFGSQLILLSTPGLRYGGLDDEKLLEETGRIVRENDNYENFCRKLAEGKTREQMFAEFQRQVYKLADARSDSMVANLLRNIHNGETGMMSVGQQHIERIIETLNGRMNFIILLPNGYDAIQIIRFDHLKEFGDNTLEMEKENNLLRRP